MAVAAVRGLLRFRGKRGVRGCARGSLPERAACQQFRLMGWEPDPLWGSGFRVVGMVSSSHKSMLYLCAWGILEMGPGL